MKKITSLLYPAAVVFMFSIAFTSCQMNTLNTPAPSAEREIRISHKVEEGKTPQTIISNYDADYLATGKFDKEKMTNYFVTIFTNKNGTVVKCNAIGKDAEYFSVVEKDIPEYSLIPMFIIDFDKTWEMMRKLKK